MDCKTEARTRQHDETANYSEIIKKMKGLGLGKEHFEKVDWSESEGASKTKKVVALAKAREKEKRESRRGESKKQVDDKQISKHEEAAITKSKKEQDPATEMDVADVIRLLTSNSPVQSPSTQSAIAENEKKIAGTETEDKDITELAESFLHVPTPPDVEDEPYSDIDIDDEWHWGTQKEKIWGEVALAPGETSGNRDLWVMVGPSGEDDDDF